MGHARWMLGQGWPREWSAEPGGAAVEEICKPREDGTTAIGRGGCSQGRDCCGCWVMTRDSARRLRVEIEKEGRPKQGCWDYIGGSER